ESDSKFCKFLLDGSSHADPPARLIACISRGVQSSPIRGIGASCGPCRVAWLRDDNRILMLPQIGDAEADPMTIAGQALSGAVAALTVVTLGTGSALGPQSAAALTLADELASHRAIYELKLAQSRGNSTVAARGRILYDFSGNACEGYSLQFRQVSELDN